MKTQTLSAAEYLRAVCFSDRRPTQADVERAYPSIPDELNKGKGDARRAYASIAQKMGVQAPYARSYREVVRTGKDQGVGLIRRHVVAAASRPSVWAGSNAFFLPRGKNGMVITGRKAAPKVLAHEAGHAKDYERLGGEKGWKKSYEGFGDRLLSPFSRRRYIKTKMLPEHRAWAESGVPDNDPLRAQALRTYANQGPMGLLLSSIMEGMIALEGRADAVLFGVDLKREPNADCPTPCDVEKPSYPTVFLRLEGEKAASLAHIKNGDEVILKGKVVSVEVRDRQGETPSSSRFVDIECRELLPEKPEEKLEGGKVGKTETKKEEKADEKKPVALDACPSAPLGTVNLSNSDRLGEVVELAMLSPMDPTGLIGRFAKTAAGGVLASGVSRFAKSGLAVPVAAGLGAAALGGIARRRGPDDDQPHPFRTAARVAAGALGAGALGLAASRSGLIDKFRSAWGAPKAPPTVAPGFRPAEYLAAVVRGEILLDSPSVPLRTVLLDSRARNGDGQFEPGAAPVDPSTMAAAYPATARPGVSALIASAHRRRQKRDLMAGGIGAAAGVAVGAGAIPAWQYLRQVVGRA